jgi:hypothetical protein
MYAMRKLFAEQQKEQVPLGQMRSEQSLGQPRQLCKPMCSQRTSSRNAQMTGQSVRSDKQVYWRYGCERIDGRCPTENLLNKLCLTTKKVAFVLRCKEGAYVPHRKNTTATDHSCRLQ